MLRIYLNILKLRSTQLDALLRNFDDYEKMLGQFEDGTGSMMREAEKTANSLEGRLNELSNTWTDTVENIADSDGLKTAVSGLNNLLKTVNALTDALGSFGTITLSGGLYALYKNFGNIQSWLGSTKTAAGAISGITYAEDGATVELYKKQLEGLTLTQQKLAMSTAGLTAEQQKYILSKIEGTAVVGRLNAVDLASLDTADRELLQKAGLIAADGAETASEIVLTEAKKQEILASTKLSETEKRRILTIHGVTNANIKQASSYDLLGGYLSSLKMKFKELWNSAGEGAGSFKRLGTSAKGLWNALPKEGKIGIVAALVWAINEIRGLSYDTSEEIENKIEEAKQKLSETESEISSLNDQINENLELIDEMKARGASRRAIEVYEEENALLESQKKILDEIAKSQKDDVARESARRLNNEGKESRLGSMLPPLQNLDITGSTKETPLFGGMLGILSYAFGDESAPEEGYAEDIRRGGLTKEDRVVNYLKNWAGDSFVPGFDTIFPQQDVADDMVLQSQISLKYYREYQKESEEIESLIKQGKLDDEEGLEEYKDAQARMSKEMSRLNDYVPQLIEYRKSLEDSNPELYADEIGKIDDILEDFEDTISQPETPEEKANAFNTYLNDGEFGYLFKNATTTDELIDALEELSESESERLISDLEKNGFIKNIEDIYTDREREKVVREYINSRGLAYDNDLFEAGMMADDNMLQIQLQDEEGRMAYLRQLVPYIANDSMGFLNDVDPSMWKIVEEIRGYSYGLEGDAYKEHLAKYMTGYSDVPTGQDRASLLTIEDSKKASDGIKTLGNAFEELNEDGYITFDMLTSLKDATNLNEEEWSRYQNILSSTKTTTAEKNAALQELTTVILENKLAEVGLNNATEEQIATVLRDAGVTNWSTMAHQIKLKCLAKEIIAEYDLAKANEDNINTLIHEGEAIGLTKNQMIDLISAELRFNANTLDPTAKIKALEAIMKAAGMTEVAIDRINGGISNKSGGEAKRAYIESYEDWEVLDGHTGENWTFDGKELYSWAYRNKKTGEVYDEIEDARVAIGLDEVEKRVSNAFATPQFKSDSSDSDSNKALDDYLKKIERAYKYHQDEKKYIEDLTYAFNNLVKKEEEALDITDSINDGYSKLADNQISDIEHEISILQSVKGKSVDVTSYYKQMQKVYENAAKQHRKTLREMGYDEATIESTKEIQKYQAGWREAENLIADWKLDFSETYIKDRNTYENWELFEDSEVEAWERVVKWLRSEYPDDLDKIKDAEENLFETRKQLIDDLVSKLNEDIETDFDIRIKRLQSQSSLLSSHFGIVNAIADEQHKINKELIEAETLGAKMAEHERETLFSKKDHATLSSKLNGIMVDITDLQNDYLRDLENANENTIDEITNQYERQYNLKMKEYEIVRAEVDLMKAQQNLKNVENEKSVRTWTGSGWSYEADIQNVLSAQEAVEDARYELTRSKAEEAQQKALDGIEANADALQTEKNTLISTLEELSESLNKEGEEVSYMLQSLANTDLPTFEAIVDAMGESLQDAFGISDEDVDKIRNKGFVLQQMKQNSAKWATSDEDTRKHLHDMNRAHADYLGLTPDPDTGRWLKPNGLAAYASGTKSAKPGVGLFDENGFGSEFILTKDGILTQFNGGEHVFSPEMAERLWQMAQQNYSFGGIVQPDFSKIVPVEDKINSAINNISSIMGDTYMIKDVQLNESEGGTLKGFINFLKTKI